jgi:hypothetical protein
MINPIHIVHHTLHYTFLNHVGKQGKWFYKMISVAKAKIPLTQKIKVDKKISTTNITVILLALNL